MLHNIIAFSINNKLVVFFGVVLVIITGLYSARTIPLDAVPDITNNQVQVITRCPSLGALEVEQYVTTPIERQLATIPGQKELRSLSRFGLSVITIVFEDGQDALDCRQLVTEQMTIAQEQIGKFGHPELGPMTTGLGEIYQYELAVAQEVADKYSLTDLRTIQDWVVKRQLLGTEGVVEVSSFGGYLKEIEIQLDPDLLRRQNLSVTEVFAKVEANNANAGGGYIEQAGKLYFIRTEGRAQSLDDIRNIELGRANGIPIRLSDIAEVNEGHSLRYGAMTANGEGETAGGIVLMLKGENSAKVVERVKARVDEIQKSLPDGITIRPFLDRSKLIEKAIKTIAINLLEGGLIVILVIFLLLGNLRASLIVASVIPISLLIALSLMKYFGISANLMSLGAIDFGLVADGAIIIAEAAVAAFAFHHIKHKGSFLNQSGKNQLVLESASAIRGSASFGEIIIIIVYIPILTLQGVEGKMFRPMAQTVSFALVGALVLSLTYVPAACALFLRGDSGHGKDFASKAMGVVEGWYFNWLTAALRQPIYWLASAVILIGAAGFTFSTLGGEFLPELEEGDFAVETRGPAGSGPERMTRLTTEIEKITAKFPQVKEVVSKIGTSEIPVDPMPVENADVIIVLKDKEKWPVAMSQSALGDTLLNALKVLPGVRFEFQQPIAMRFNELMTGSKSDLALTLYGSDLELLKSKASEVEKLIQKIEGIQSVKLDQVEGMPQVRIKLNREALVRQGVNVDDANKLIGMTLAGLNAGPYFEGERRFDIVFRLGIEKRKELSAIGQLPIKNALGQSIPLSEVAEIQFEETPVQVTHKKASRAFTIGINVSGKDVETVVNDIDNKLQSSLVLPTGYSYEIGGQYENLLEAKSRLQLMIPLSLLLIFFLLYLSFRNFSQAIIIFTAIPFSAVGGVFALSLRDMNFSISAGVGFIALFGVAVLNGIVMISAINHAKESGISQIGFAVLRAGVKRLRPVLITAIVAALGFFPMAFTHSAGAEVQKPLATVVIGGVATAAVLTLFILPILVVLVSKWKKPRTNQIPKLIMAISLCLVSSLSHGQSLSLQDAESELLKNNQLIQSKELAAEVANKRQKGWLDLPKTQLDYQFGRTQQAFENDYTFGVVQQSPWPKLLQAQKGILRTQSTQAKAANLLTQKDLLLKLRLAYSRYSYHSAWLNELSRQDSVLNKWIKGLKSRQAQGDLAKPQLLVATNRQQQLKIKLANHERELQIERSAIATLVGLEDIKPAVLTLQNLGRTPIPNSKPHPFSDLIKAQLDENQFEKSRVKGRALPDFKLGYLNQSIMGVQGQQVLLAGIGIPLVNKGENTLAQTADKHALSKAKELSFHSSAFRQDSISAWRQWEKTRTQRDIYESQLLKDISTSIDLGKKAFELGELDFSDYFLILEQSFAVNENWIDAQLSLMNNWFQLQYFTE